MKKKNIQLISLGCAKNLVDSEILLGGLKNSDFNIVMNSSEADLVVVNTCGFLDTAREESVDTILEAGELRKSGDLEKLIVMGCFSQRYSSELKNALPEVDAFFGTNDHGKIIAYLTGSPHMRDDPEYYRSLLTPKHYAYLKIAEGCDNGCSFCSIPLMRGLQVSRPVNSIITETQRLVRNGVKEILVIAQDSTSYGWDLNPASSLHQLISQLDKIEDLDWLRLHYAHPAHLHRDMIKLFGESEKLLPYIDMPIQHGSDRILKAMRRGLNSDGIRKRIDALRNVNSRMIIRTSIIVGFPGETDDDFQKLYDLVSEVEFDRLGVFTYSEEEGTFAADKMDDSIPTQIKYDRMDALMLLQQEISLSNNQALVGKTEKVLIDVHMDDGTAIARTYRDSPEVDNIVQIDGMPPVGEFCQVRFTEAGEYELTGELV